MREEEKRRRIYVLMDYLMMWLVRLLTVVPTLQ